MHEKIQNDESKKKKNDRKKRAKQSMENERNKRNTQHFARTSVHWVYWSVHCCARLCCWFVCMRSGHVHSFFFPSFHIRRSHINAAMSKHTTFPYEFGRGIGIVFALKEATSFSSTFICLNWVLPTLKFFLVLLSFGINIKLLICSRFNKIWI